MQGSLEILNKIIMDISFDPDISAISSPRITPHSLCQAPFHTCFTVLFLVDCITGLLYHHNVSLLCYLLPSL